MHEPVLVGPDPVVHPGATDNPTWTINTAAGPRRHSPTPDNWPVAQRNFGCPTAASRGTYDQVIIHVQVKHKLLVPGLFSQFFGNKTSPTFTSDSVFQLEPVPTSTCP